MTLHQERLKTRLVGLLLLVTLGAIGFQTLDFTRVLRVDQNPAFTYEAIDDRSNNGLSTARIERLADGRLLLHCNIVASTYPWPYCDVAFNLRGAGVKGLDLSGYSHVKLWVKYTTPQTTGIRFQVRNFNPAYARADAESTFKYNSIEFYQKNSSYPIAAPLSSFQVPTWWLTENEIPIAWSGPEFSNALWVEVATGANISPGSYSILIERIEFAGKLVSDTHLYLALLLLWGLAGLVYVTRQISYIRGELLAANLREEELEALNQLMDVKSRRLQEKLTRDPLTGVLNRDGIAYLFNDPARRPTRLSLIFIDIDHFKRVNDTHGHNVGDEVLQRFAKVVSENIRESDVLARWGGEEFVLACPNTDLMKAARLAEKLRLGIAQSHWPLHMPLTASFGVAQMQHESPTDFIARADKALYAAKAQGRNRVFVSQPQDDDAIAG